MAKLIAVSIDVTKLDKSKFVTGKKGTYANLTISLNDEPDQYNNDVSVWEGQSEDERKSKADRNFLGNGKVVWSSECQTQQPKQSKKAVKEEEDDLLPF
jgi:hypothetical protein